MFEVDSSKLFDAVSKKRFSVKQIAKLSGLNYLTVSKMIRQNCLVRLETLAKIAAVLDVLPRSLIKS